MSRDKKRQEMLRAIFAAAGDGSFSWDAGFWTETSMEGKLRPTLCLVGQYQTPDLVIQFLDRRARFAIAKVDMAESKFKEDETIIPLWLEDPAYQDLPRLGTQVVEVARLFLRYQLLLYGHRERHFF